MVQVRRANVILDIKEEQINEYLGKGYDVINSKGDVVQASVPNDANVLRKAYVDHLKEIKTLKETIDSLNAEIKSLKNTKTAKPRTRRTTKKKTEDKS